MLFINTVGIVFWSQVVLRAVLLWWFKSFNSVYFLLIQNHITLKMARARQPSTPFSHNPFVAMILNGNGIELSCVHITRSFMTI